MIKLDENKKKLLLKIDKLIDSNKKYEYKELINLYNYIDKKIIKNNIDYFYLNHFIKYYKQKNIYLKIKKKIKLFVRLKNKLILNKTLKSKKYRNFIIDLQKKLKKEGINKSFDKINNNFIKILEKYKDNWLGYWANIIIDTKGNIKKIDLFDINDYNYLKKN
jgi:hypothetical protein